MSAGFQEEIERSVDEALDECRTGVDEVKWSRSRDDGGEKLIHFDSETASSQII